MTLLALLLCFFPPLPAQDGSGRTTVLFHDAQGAPVVNARVVVKDGNAIAGSATTDRAGQMMINLGAGTYLFEVSAPNTALYSQEVTLTSGEQLLQVSLRPRIAESIEVQAGNSESTADSSSPVTVLPVQQVRELPSRPKTALDALPLVPGVVRTQDGQLQIAGQSEAHSALLIDGIDSSSPSSGRFALSPPIDAVQTIQVETPSFLAQDGRLSAGVVKIETKGGGDRWHFDLSDPFPEFRIRSGHVRGVRSMSPRVTVGGPIVQGRVQVLESFGFNDNKTPVRTLAFPNNETKAISSNSFTRGDIKISSSQDLALTVQVAPQSIRYAGLDFFHPQAVTTDNSAATYVGTAAHRLVFGRGFLQSKFSEGNYTESTKPQGPADMVVRPTGYSGSFYRSATQSSHRTEWNEALTFVLPAHPQHQLSVGSSVAVVHGEGSVAERPVLIQDAAGALIQRIDFTGGSRFHLRDVQPAVYAQDHWSPKERLLIDYGLRYEGQTITGTWRLAPRAAVAWNTGTGTHSTVVRGGIGVFYDSVPLATFSFPSFPMQHITKYGETNSIQEFTNLLGASVHENQELVDKEPRGGDFSPMTVTESLQVEHRWSEKLTTSARILHSGASALLTVAPSPSPSPSSFVLSDGGTSNYTQLEVTARLDLQKGFPLYTSYVRSISTGSLNMSNEILSQAGTPFVRSAAVGRQPSDLPNRFLLWGSVRLPWQVTVTPHLEIRTGFLYQSLDAYQNFVQSSRQFQGRLPSYASLDLRVSKLVKLNPKYSLRPALSMTNATNHFNGLEVHNNTADPQFGTPFGNNDRHARFDLDVVF